jgi:hypothetical protein
MQRERKETGRLRYINGLLIQRRSFVHIFVRTYHGRNFHAADFLYSVADLADPGASLGQRAFLAFTNEAVNEANRLQSLLRLVFALAVHKLRG